VGVRAGEALAEKQALTEGAPERVGTVAVALGDAGAVAEGKLAVALGDEVAEPDAAALSVAAEGVAETLPPRDARGVTEPQAEGDGERVSAALALEEVQSEKVVEGRAERDADTQLEALTDPTLAEGCAVGEGGAVCEREPLPLEDALAQGVGRGLRLPDCDAAGDAEGCAVAVAPVSLGCGDGVGLPVEERDADAHAEPLRNVVIERVGDGQGLAVGEREGLPLLEAHAVPVPDAQGLSVADAVGLLCTVVDALGVVDVATVPLTVALPHPDGVRDAHGEGEAVLLQQGVALAIAVPLTDALPLTLAEGVPQTVGDGEDEGEELTDTQAEEVGAGEGVAPGEPLSYAEALSHTLEAAEVDTVTLSLPVKEAVAAAETEGWDAEALMVAVGLGEGAALEEPLPHAEALPHKLTAADADTVTLALPVGEGVVATEAECWGDMEALVVDEKEGGGVTLPVSSEDHEDAADGVGEGDKVPVPDKQSDTVAV
jgi:hypothetical protein